MFSFVALDGVKQAGGGPDEIPLAASRVASGKLRIPMMLPERA